MEQHRREIALTEGIYDITTRIANKQEAADENVVYVFYPQDVPTLGQDTESE